MLNEYDVCDWVDNACAIEIVEKTTTYGYMRVPINVSAFTVSRTEYRPATLAAVPDDLDELPINELR